jgi:hypothetical protein
LGAVVPTALARSTVAPVVLRLALVGQRSLLCLKRVLARRRGEVIAP